MAENQIIVKDLTFQRNDKVILEDINMILHKGELITIVGPNGGGKSTLIKIIVGLQKPSKGLVWKRDNLKIGYMPQKIKINPMLPLSVGGFLSLDTPVTSSKALKEVMGEIGLKNLNLKSSIHNISGGEMQKLMLARLMLLSPDVLILDEPTQGIDVVGQKEFYDALLRIKQNSSIIIVSHDLYTVLAASDYVVCINKHICCEGKAGTIKGVPWLDEINSAYYEHHHNHKH